MLQTTKVIVLGQLVTMTVEEQLQTLETIHITTPLVVTLGTIKVLQRVLVVDLHTRTDHHTMHFAT